MGGRRNYAGAAIVLVAMLALSGRGTMAQISVEEANKKLQEKMAAGQSTTQPIGELARLAEENRKLRLRVAELESQVAALRAVPNSVGATAANPTTLPASEPTASPIVGRWRGGDISRGSGYVLEFNADGSYARTFISYNKREAGRYRMVDSNTVEMWTDPNSIAGQRNEYHTSIATNQLILTPTMSDGAEVRTGRAIVLAK